MNTNAATHTDLVWSFQFDKSGVPITIAAAVVVTVVLIVLARNRKKT